MKILAFTLAILATPVLASHSPGKCGPAQEIVGLIVEGGESLLHQMEEHDSDSVLATFADESSGSWTIVRTNMKLRSCIIAWGIGFRVYVPKDDLGQSL